MFKIDLMTPQIINKIYIASTVERRVFLKVSCLQIQMLAQTFSKLSIQEQWKYLLVRQLHVYKDLLNNLIVFSLYQQMDSFSL